VISLGRDRKGRGENERGKGKKRANGQKMKIYVKNEGKREKHLWNTPIYLD
jgi:hypothetical protein